jgi:hypothetical protein
MDKVTIEIKTGGSAFEGYEEKEIARILRDIADKIENGYEPTKPLDINGNSCGFIKIK